MKVYILVIWVLPLISMYTTAASCDAPTDAVWVAHPDNPGSNIPAAGISLFDKLFNQNKSLPFPFSSLVNSLSYKTTPHGNTQSLRVLIPIGRSLQREAAAPNYYHSPREVIAINGETNQQVLTNRLFIAYQQASQQLEVISFNDEAGRFEFQTIENYNEAGQPIRKYASRGLCMSCHQNGGPIFSVSPWSETNFKVNVARRIAKARPDIYPSMLNAISNDSIAFDHATNYANYLTIAQIIWREACGSLGACRAALLTAIIQKRLSGNLGYDPQRIEFVRDVQRHIANQWTKNWPGGLLFPTANIPDYNPITEPVIPIIQNATFLRPADAHWKYPSKVFLQGIVQQLSGFFTTADIATLDQHLARLAKQNQLASSIVKTRCALSLNAHWQQWSKANINCGNSNKLTLNLDLTREPNGGINWQLERLSINDNHIAWKINLQSIQSTESKTLSANFNSDQIKLSTRLTSGNLLERIEIQFDPDASQATVTLHSKDDFEYIAQAIHSMQYSTESTALESGYFYSVKTMDELERHLVLPTN
ncbi:MAG: hypothetical protein ACI8P9_003798 [Parasphingorhabdus sp.]|jgi:hypothetical protein